MTAITGSRCAGSLDTGIACSPARRGDNLALGGGRSEQSKAISHNDKRCADIRGDGAPQRRRQPVRSDTEGGKTAI